jgi:hypothetical protein
VLVQFFELSQLYFLYPSQFIFHTNPHRDMHTNKNFIVFNCANMISFARSFDFNLLYFVLNKKTALAYVLASSFPRVVKIYVIENENHFSKKMNKSYKEIIQSQTINFNVNVILFTKTCLSIFTFQYHHIMMNISL